MPFPRSLTYVLSALLALLWLSLVPHMAAGQSLYGLTGGTTPEEPATTADDDPLSRAVRTAAENGVSVIVVDSNGNLLSTPGAAADPGTTGEGPPLDSEMSDLMKAQSEASEFRETLRSRIDAWPQSINEVAFILRATSPDGRIMTYVEALFWTLVLLAIGRVAAVQIYGKRIARGFVVSRIQEAPQGYREKMPFLVFRFFMGIGGTLFGMLVSYILGILIFGPVSDLSLQFTLTAIYLTFFVTRTIGDVWRMILSPFLAQYRVPKFSDTDSKKLYYWLTVVATMDISVIMFSTWIADFGLNYDVYALMYAGLAGIMALINIALIVFNRRAISTAICNGKAFEDLSFITRLLILVWAPFSIGYIAFSWLKLAFDLVLERPTSMPLIVASYGALMSIIIVYGLINYLIEAWFHRARLLREMNEQAEQAEQAEQSEISDDDGVLTQTSDMPETPAIQQPYRITNFEDLARRVSGILAFVAGTFAMLYMWGSQSVVFDDSRLDKALDVVVILFIGYIIYNVFRIWIDSRIAEELPDASEGELGDEGGGSSASRLATLLPLFRNAILIIVVVSIGFIVLMELGINVSPLFAGAGVVGLAVGFGAQALVRDIFSGAFFLFDDAFRKGEYIDIGSVKGTVEKISVRSFQLRHHLGALHTIPFGEIQVLTNYSRDWVIMKLKLRVTYDTDVEHVRKLIKKLGQELLSDPVIGENFIQPLKSQGVVEMQDSAMIIRVKFMTKPGDQWLVRKKVYEEIRALFEREGIKFAHREVTVRLADEDKAEDLTPKQREKVVAAAEAAIDDDAMDLNPGGDDR